MIRQYNNGLTPELLTTLDRSPFRIEFSESSKVDVALVGDHIVPPDGRTAKIIMGVCKLSEVNGRGGVLVKSRMDNGDGVISTSCDGQMLVGRKGEVMPDNFLPTVEVA